MSPTSGVGMPQICVLLASISMILYGSYYVAYSMAHKRERVEGVYMKRYGRWEEAREEFRKSSFTLRSEVVRPSGAPSSFEVPLVQNDKDDRLSEIVSSSHLPPYKNLFFTSPSSVFPPGTISAPVFAGGSSAERVRFTIEGVSPDGKKANMTLGTWDVAKVKVRHPFKKNPFSFSKKKKKKKKARE